MNIQGGVYIPPGVIIEHDCFIGPCVVFTNDRYPPSERLLKTHVGYGVIIGANCTIAPGIRLEPRCVIGQGSNVIKSVMWATVVYGNPAVFMGWRDAYDLKKEEYEKG